MIEKINKYTWEKNRSRVEKAKAGPSIANTRNECKWCGQQHTYGNCPAYRKTCNACGKLNHFAAVCRTRRIRNLIAENEGDESFEGGINVNKVLVKTVRSDKWSAVISINGNKTSVHLDTGAQINVLPQKVISLWPAKPIIKPTSLKAYAYGHSELPIVGKCEVLCQYGEKKSLCEFIIADVDAQTLITGDTCEKLEILKRINQINSHEMILHDQTKKILEQFHEVFQGVGVINSECKMYTKPEYPPVRALPRRIPAALGNEVQSELEKMVKQGIITKIYHETEWSHPMVVVKKKSGQIRICLDPRKLNQALVRRHFQTPAPSELLHQIPKADYYTVLDVKSAYWHVPVANECRDLLVMATPFGKFRYNRLPFGLNISAQIFVEMMTNIFKNSFRNVTYVDDLLIYADSIEEHNEKLKGILEIARRNNIKFDLTKAQICKKEVSFLGHMISKNGIDPEPNKVDKVINLKKPEDKKSLQRVMGLYNYLGKFIPNLAASTSNIRGILKKNLVWHWGPRQDTEFHHIKECVRNAPSLGHYDKTKTLVLQCDASKDAMGAALLQENRPLAFASASFNDSQKQYSQIEKELLSIYYGCKKFEYLLLGHTFIIQTDHQPLLPLIQKPLTDISPRLQRIVMKLFAFDFKLQYRPGKCLILADTLSRDTHPIDELPTPFLEDRRMVKLISANISDEKLITLQKDTRGDTTLLKIIHYVIEGWPISKKDVDEDVKPYYDFRHRIYLWNELLCVGSAIVVPETQRNYMLELLHKSHQGISAIQGLARESLFWPGMSMDIAERVKSCDICQKYQKSKTRETFSGYPEVYALNPPTATNVRNKLRETFARFGIPETIMSDNGPPFHSEIMTDFCTKWGIRQIFSSPHLHRSNGLAERNIQTIKILLNKCKDQGSDAYLALLTYRNTPKNDLPSPAQLCLSRSLRCLIPRITPLYGPCKTNHRHIENAKKRRQNSMKRYYDRSSKIYPKVSVGEEAWCQLSPKQAWTPVKITAHGNSPQSFKVETPSGREFLRNQQFLRPKNGPSGKGESPSLGTSFSGESSPVAADSSSWQRTTEEEPVAGPSTTPIQQQPSDGMAVPSENSSVMPRFSRFARFIEKPWHCPANQHRRCPMATIAKSDHQAPSAGQQLKTKFVAGIIDSSTQKKLLQEENLTFDGAVDIALSAESADNELHNMKGSENAIIPHSIFTAINNTCKHCGIKCHLDVKADFIPKFYKFRQVHFALKQLLEDEIDKLVDLNILSPIDRSDCASPLVCVAKPDGQIRLCADFKKSLNPYLEDVKYPIPNIDSVLSNFQGKKLFTKLDLSKAYHQIEMDDISKKYILSRFPEFQKNNSEYNDGSDEILLLITSIIDHVLVAHETHLDRTLFKLYEIIETGELPSSPNDDLIPYLKRIDDFTILQKCIFLENRMVIPKSLHEKVLQLLHESHAGTNKMKMMARSSIWWPGMDSSIEIITKNCRTCLSNEGLPHQRTESWPKYAGPWRRVHMDYFNFKNRLFLLAVDSFTSWVEVSEVPSTSAYFCINFMRNCIARYGFPQVVVSDNGPPFFSSDFGDFLSKNGTSHVTSPISPKIEWTGRSLCKRGKEIAKKLLYENEQVEIDLALSRALFFIRTDVNIRKGTSPAELFLGRKIRSRLSMLSKEEVKVSKVNGQYVNSKFKVYETVKLRWITNNHPSWYTGKIIKILGRNVYLIKQGDSEKKVHQNYIKKLLPGKSHPTNMNDAECVPTPISEEKSVTTPRYPQRERRCPQR
ncbi:K02A2.6-like [Cordylochernes scorpioides]|uniref:RNA-directed DNA polymerase n=1 Tax=Cordylochernes scorpioides TaxID=51811 RepID=A0ABY6L8U6_9ARAC|nr:K02A2.6-like [Cordylochernes scorpioides]